MIAMMQQEGTEDLLASDRRIFSWRINLAVFGALIAITLLFFFFQLRHANQGFKKRSLDHSRLVAGVIQENVQNGLLAAALLDKTIGIFLTGSGNFAAYLESIEPFSEEELTAFSKEAGLAGITIIRSDMQVSGPEGWFPEPARCDQPFGLLHQNRDVGLAYTVLPLQEGGVEHGCLLVGFDISRIIELRERTEITQQLSALTGLSGIRYVRIDEPSSEKEEGGGEKLQLLRGGEEPIVESRLTTTIGTLVVGLDASRYTRRLGELREQFILFAGLLLILGLFSSWLLYRYQQSELLRTRQMERVLGRQHEEAALGRATATIAHEIRNPLNALHMGIQRIRLESNNLDQEQLEMLGAMDEATRRTDMIINDLKRFSRPLTPKSETLRPAVLLEQAIQLYRPLLEEQQIDIMAELDRDLEMKGDALLLAELLENLVKNAVEAQPAGGQIRVRCRREGSDVIIDIANHGCNLVREDLPKICEPYFTTKTRGTGLGLSLARRIVEAHAGTLTPSLDDMEGELTMRVILPQQP
jgi:signal transduction histidine kinase